MVLKKQVDATTSSLSRYPQNQENISNEELMKQKGRCEKLQAILCNKGKEINELKMKIVSLETRASSAEQENDSLKLACNTDVIFFAYFRRTDAKARRARGASRTRGKEREKNNACRLTIVQAVPAFKYERGYPIGYLIQYKNKNKLVA